MIRLDIGSGGPGEDGRIGVDPYAPGADVVAFGWALPYDDSSVDEIFSSHALEHIEKRKVVPTLTEWARVIKPEGKIIIRVPDLVWCCTHWLQHQDNGWSMDTLFGHQAHEGEFHRTGFTKALMKGYLQEAGLVLVVYEELETHGQKTMSFECTKASSLTT